MAYLTNREFAEQLFRQEKRNEYTDALMEEVRQLREEKQEREKGCEYCNTENNRYLTDDIFLAHKERHLTSNNGMEFRTINFCPMCGKSLKEDANETQDY